MQVQLRVPVAAQQKSRSGNPDTVAAGVCLRLLGGGCWAVAVAGARRSQRLWVWLNSPRVGSTGRH